MKIRYGFPRIVTLSPEYTDDKNGEHMHHAFSYFTALTLKQQ